MSNDKTLPTTVEKPTANNNDMQNVEEDLVAAQRSTTQRRGSSFLLTAVSRSSSVLRRVSGLSNGDDIESGGIKDDDTVESVDMEDEDELMDVSAAVVVASGNAEELPQEETASTPPTRTHSTRKLVLASLLLLLVGLAIGLGLGFGLQKNNNSSSNEVNSSSSASSATTAPQFNEEEQDFYSEREHTVRPTSTILPTLIPEGDDDDCFPDFDPDSFTTTFVEFPCLLGMPGDEAAALLEEAYPNMLDIQVLPENSPITMDLRFNRVRIFVSHLSNLVVQVPHVG